MTRQDFLIKWGVYALALVPVWFLELFVLNRFPLFGVAPMLLPLAAVCVAVLEGTTAADLPGTAAHKRVAAPGKGPVLSFMDGGTAYDRELFELLRRLAQENGIPWQTKDYISGGNDASAIQRTKAGVRVAAVSAPVRYLHTPSSVASVRDFGHMYTLTRKFIEAIAASSNQ